MFLNEFITHYNPSYAVSKYCSIAFSTAAHIYKKVPYISLLVYHFQARTPQQWDASGGKVTKSPPCLGGSRETASDKAHEGSKMDGTSRNVTDTR